MSYQENTSLKSLQDSVLNISEYFVEFCIQHGLRCFLCGGGVIGAIRHKGFIPWDDDLDFFMPRKDYEKLKMLWKNEEHFPFVLSFPSRNYNDHNIFSTVRDASTTMIKPYQQHLDITHGIAIDIFPLDVYPNSALKRGLQVFWAFTFQLFCSQMVPVNYGPIVSIFGKLLLALGFNRAIRHQIWSYAEKQMSKGDFDQADFITELCAGPKYMFKKYPKNAFKNSVLVPFQNTYLPIPKGYPIYLKMAFGDYMELPPIEHQIPSHEAIMISTDVPYDTFRGKYFCIKSTD